MIKTKNKNDFNNNLTKVFNLMSLTGKYNMVGSASLKSIYYSSDIDLNELDNSDTSKSIYEKFKHIFEVCKSDKKYFITDFKCGLDKHNESLRWSYDDIMRGSCQGILFNDAIKMNSTIKLDIVYLLNGIFTEITEVYFIKLGKHQNYDNKELNSKNIKNELQKEFHELVNENNYFKALKRLFSILQIEKKFSDVDKFIHFFNSESGILYKANADLQILITVIDNKFRKPEISDIKNNLQIIKQNLSIQTETHKNCSKIIDSICERKKLTEMIIFIQKLSEYISKVYNRSAKIFLDQMN